MKYSGIAISTSLHFALRGIIAILTVRFSGIFKESLLPIINIDSITDLNDIFKIGFQKLLLSGMNWWAFDVFTLLAS